MLPHPDRPERIAVGAAGDAAALVITAGPEGLTYLAYGTREPGDIVAYPEAGTARIRGLGVTLALES